MLTIFRIHDTIFIANEDSSIIRFAHTFRFEGKTDNNNNEKPIKILNAQFYSHMHFSITVPNMCLYEEKNIAEFRERKKSIKKI